MICNIYKCTQAKKYLTKRQTFVIRVTARSFKFNRMMISYMYIYTNSIVSHADKNMMTRVAVCPSTFNTILMYYIYIYIYIYTHIYSIVSHKGRPWQQG